eukprot:CCRYP_016649-RA/>CCRYP_016649-RA protein AED:0.44 eAED:0.58 QI:0/0/0/1/0/0/2/0/160
MYMELPKIETRHGSSKDHMLMLLSNLWSKTGWSGIGFQPSFIDECVFFRGGVIFIVYVDDGIFLGPNDQSLTNVIREIAAAGLDIEDQGHPADYVGVTITKHSNGAGFTSISLMPSSMASTSAMPTLNRYQPRLHNNFMHTKTLHDLTNAILTSITVRYW